METKNPLTINEVCDAMRVIVEERSEECSMLMAEYNALDASVGEEALTAWARSRKRFRRANEILCKIIVMTEVEGDD